MQKHYTKKVVASNRKAYFNYTITKKYTAAPVLKGHEVKSVKAGQMSIKESYVRVENDEAWLINAHIPLWKFTQLKDYDPTRRRKLLLHKREIHHLNVEQNAKKKAIVPLKVFIAKGKIKITLGVGVGKKKFDKRRQLKERQIKENIRDDLSRRKHF